VALNATERIIPLGSCKRSAAELVRNLPVFAGHVERFLHQFPEIRRLAGRTCDAHGRAGPLLGYGGKPGKHLKWHRKRAMIDARNGVSSGDRVWQGGFENLRSRRRSPLEHRGSESFDRSLASKPLVALDG
jgi:hypothetical protein